MRLFTALFGTYHLTVRAPALIGAALYVSAAYVFCILLRTGSFFQWALFACFVFNPFVLDYLVAARGYSLAVGFLMWAIVIPVCCFSVTGRLDGSTVRRACRLTSVCLSLSFAGNFSFAFIDAAMLLMVWIWAMRREDRITRRPLAILLACTVPGLVVSLFLTMSVVLSFPKSQLWYGATSLGQTFHSVVEASFYRLNPNILSPLVYPLALQLKPFLLPALLAFCAGKAALALSRREGGDGWLVSFGGFLTGAVSIALGAHWISFRLFHILLPLDRTALFLVPLPLAITGAIGALRPSSQVEKVFHKGLTATLFLLAVYFICCLRLTYFKEWI